MSAEQEDEDYSMMSQGVDVLCAAQQQNAMVLQESAARIANYEQTLKTIQSLPNKTSHKVLAPLCGGCAYLEGELIHTNELIVLLGDNWFAERSAVEAEEIIQRRLKYLSREREQLQAEKETIEMKQKIIQQEQLLAEDVTAKVFDDPSTDLAPPVDVDDDLTLEELAELEKEIGEEVFDDALLERKIVEFKMRRRSGGCRSDNKRQQMAATVAVQSGTAVCGGAPSDGCIPRGKTESSSPPPKFTRPSDIFAAFEASAAQTMVSGDEHRHHPEQHHERHSCTARVFRQSDIVERAPTSASNPPSQAEEGVKTTTKRKNTKRSLFWGDEGNQ